MLKNKLNPQQIIKNILGNNSNPMINNLVQMAQKGDKQGVEKFARNMLKERGRDFDSEFSQFMGQFK
jgi:hypothetical protein